MQRARILILLVSGSALSYGPGKKRLVQSEREVAAWMREMQELSIMAEIDATYVANAEGSGVSPALWQSIGRVISDNYTKFDGFVISHEVETLHYTAPALGAALGNTGKPVVLTASPHDLLRPKVPANIRALFAHARGLGQKDNLLNALHVAEYSFGDVCAVFGNQIHRAIELTTVAPPDAQYFRSLSGILLGKVDFGLKLFPPIRKQSNRAVKFATDFASDMVVIDVHPGMQITDRLSGEVMKAPGVLVKLDPASQLSSAHVSALEKLQKSKVPVIVYQQEAQQDRLSSLPLLHTLPYHSAFVLSSWIFAQAKNTTQVQRLLKEKIKEILHH
ncbi:MAG: asparaginase [Candidatus Nomurabacteria bacterium]|nr:MAG: asparaginase [Candidatus Nomurabacteria bacterium]